MYKQYKQDRRKKMINKEMLTKVFHIKNHTFMIGNTKFIFDWSSIGGSWRFDYSDDIVYVKKEEEDNSKRKIFNNPNEIGNNPYSDLEFYINVAQAYGLNIYELIDCLC